MYLEILDVNPFLDNVFGKEFFNKCSQIYKSLLILFNIETDIDSFKFDQFLAHNDVWLLRKYENMMKTFVKN